MACQHQALVMQSIAVTIHHEVWRALELGMLTDLLYSFHKSILPAQVKYSDGALFYLLSEKFVEPSAIAIYRSSGRFVKRLTVSLGRGQRISSQSIFVRFPRPSTTLGS